MNGGRHVTLEMGCGINVPVVMRDSEGVLLDCAQNVVLHILLE